jgi:Domain of Unknown Function (DUF1080)
MISKCLAPRIRLGFSGALLGLVGVLLTGCAGTADREEPFRARTISFDLSEVGKLPRNFTTALTGGGGPVSWVVREDAESPDGKPVLVQESAEGTNYRFPLCIYDKVVASDLTVEVQFKALSGKVDQAGGIVLRYTPDNYYVARANALENSVILFKTVNGQRSKIVEVPAKVPGGVWHTLRFEAKGARLKVFFDGKRVIDHADNTFLNPGKVGVWTKADSVSAFTGLKIEPVR